MKNHIASLVCMAAAATLAAAPAHARERPKLPGRGPANITKTVIFNVSDAPSGAGVYGAMVSCELAGAKKRKRTDWTGTAPVSFTFERRPRGSRARAECLVSKSGYDPDYAAFDLADDASSQLVRIRLVPR